MNAPGLPSLLRRLGACDSSIDWAISLGHDDIHRAWMTCDRGDWLLYAASWIAVDRRAVTAADCACARLALPFYEAVCSDDVPWVCVATAEAWAAGAATADDVRAAVEALSESRQALRDRWFATRSTSDTFTHTAAVHALEAVSLAADSVFRESLSDMFRSGGGALLAADAALTRRSEMHARCADAVRRVLTWPMIADALTERMAVGQ